MSDNKSQDINKDNSELFKVLADVSKQNSESITKLGEGQETMTKTLDNINETLKNVTTSDNNNPTGPGYGMDQTPKVSSDKDVGDKTKIPNVIAPDEHGVQGNPDAGKDKGGLSMEAKKEFELKLKAEEAEAKDKKDYEDYKEKKKADEDEKTKTELEEKKKAEEDEKKTHAEAEEKKKAEKENKYKSFSYDNNTTLRPAIMTKQFESYPDGYQIIKAALGGWGIEGIDADGAYTETLTKLNNHEFGTFGQIDTGASYQ